MQEELATLVREGRLAADTTERLYGSGSRARSGPRAPRHRARRLLRREPRDRRRRPACGWSTTRESRWGPSPGISRASGRAGRCRRPPGTASSPPTDPRRNPGRGRRSRRLEDPDPREERVVPRHPSAGRGRRRAREAAESARRSIVGCFRRRDPVRGDGAVGMHGSRPFVSVIVPVYNDAQRLRRCLAALRDQTYPRERYEVVVVDNASTDDLQADRRCLPGLPIRTGGSPRLLRRPQPGNRRQQGSDPRVHRFRLPAGSRLDRGRRPGAREPSGLRGGRRPDRDGRPRPAADHAVRPARSRLGHAAARLRRALRTRGDGESVRPSLGLRSGRPLRRLVQVLWRLRVVVPLRGGRHRARLRRGSQDLPSHAQHAPRVRAAASTHHRRIPSADADPGALVSGQGIRDSQDRSVTPSTGFAATSRTEGSGRSGASSSSPASR